MAHIVPWVHRAGDILLFTAGPDTLELAASVEVHGEKMKTVATFPVRAGESQSFVLNYRPSHVPTQASIDARQALKETERLWRQWSGRCRYRGRWRGPVIRLSGRMRVAKRSRASVLTARCDSIRRTLSALRTASDRPIHLNRA
jgi:hypothetical protein